jgi:hypothetical protein
MCKVHLFQYKSQFNKVFNVNLGIYVNLLGKNTNFRNSLIGELT